MPNVHQIFRKPDANGRTEISIICVLKQADSTDFSTGISKCHSSRHEREDRNSVPVWNLVPVVKKRTGTAFRSQMNPGFD